MIHQSDPKDPFDLNRFLAAQETVYERALAELKDGRKRSHWMWFIFPQIAGLGFSSTSKFYAIKSRDEAIAYANHPVLGARLRECARAVAAAQGRSAGEIFGSPDDIKLKSCMTLFASLSDSDPVFDTILERFFGGERDTRTLQLLTAD